MDDYCASKIKEISLEILKDFDKFCKENNLEYMISYGTALGAVRHGGFIPWDDDIDVNMPIEDYEKLVKAWKKNGDKNKYFLQTKRTDPNICRPFYRLRLNGTTWTEPGYETYPIHWGLPLDIFPVYHISENKKLQYIQTKLFELAMTFCTQPWFMRKFSGFKYTMNYFLTLVFLNAVYCMSCLCKKSSLVFDQTHIRNKKLYFPSNKIKFEDSYFSGPADAHAYLTVQYGEDYMDPPPENKKRGHPEGIIDLENDSEKYTGVRIRNK